MHSTLCFIGSHKCTIWRLHCLLIPKQSERKSGYYLSSLRLVSFVPTCLPKQPRTKIRAFSLQFCEGPYQKQHCWKFVNRKRNGFLVRSFFPLLFLSVVFVVFLVVLLGKTAKPEGAPGAPPTPNTDSANMGAFSLQFCEGSYHCLLYTSPSPRDRTRSRMPSSA